MLGGVQLEDHACLCTQSDAVPANKVSGYPNMSRLTDGTFCVWTICLKQTLQSLDYLRPVMVQRRRTLLVLAVLVIVVVGL